MFRILFTDNMTYYTALAAEGRLDVKHNLWTVIPKNSFKLSDQIREVRIQAFAVYVKSIWI